MFIVRWLIDLIDSILFSFAMHKECPAHMGLRDTENTVAVVSSQNNKLFYSSVLKYSAFSAKFRK